MFPSTSIEYVMGSSLCKSASAAYRSHERRSRERAGVYRRDPVPAIDLTVRNDVEEDWQPLAAAELTRPFDPATAPLMRATLVTHRMTSSLLLVFDHVIADGISAISVLNDLLSALNGEPLTTLPLPKSLEGLATRKFSPVRVEDVSLDVDPRMVVPTSIRPVDATTPHIHRVAVTARRRLVSSGAAVKNAQPCMRRS